MSKTGFLIALAAIVLFFTQSCQTQHKIQVEPVEVKPIHITVDVNVKIDRELEDYFGDIDELNE